MPSSGVQTCARSEEHTSELQSHDNLVCRLLLEKKMTHQNREKRPKTPAPCGARPGRRVTRRSAHPPVGVRPRRAPRSLFCLFFLFFFLRTRPPRNSPLPPPPPLSNP